MTRLLILLTLPAHISPTQAEDWLHAALGCVTALDDVKRAELSRVQPGSRRYAHTWDRLLELELAEDVEPGGWADTGPCGDWLADLRSLGLHPAVLLADPTTVLAGKPGT